MIWTLRGSDELASTMGGCISSSAGRDINDVHPNVFVVSAINDKGKVTSEGTIKITETDLILHRKGREDKWPLKSLRRYGAEDDIFSFESGRRCPMGEGIFAFRCQRAPRLLALLQGHLRSNTTSASGSGPPPPPLPPSNPNNNNTDGETTGADSQRRRNQDSLQQPTDVSDATSPQRQRLTSLSADLNAQSGQPEYANVNCQGAPLVVAPRPSFNHSLEAHDGYLVPNTPGGTSQKAGGFLYENVGPSSNTSATMPAASKSADHLAISSARSPGGASSISEKQNQTQGAARCFTFSESEKPTAAAADPDEGAELDYATVSFAGHRPSGTQAAITTFTPSPNGVAAGAEIRGEYCTIDIEATNALKMTAQQQTLRTMDPSGTSDSPAGVRKTRHSSTLGEIFGTKRNSVIVSGD